MRKEQDPSLRAAWLGQELKAMRRAVKLTGKQLGEYLHIDSAIISRIENGHTAPTEHEVKEYMRLCGVTDAKRCKDIMTICHDAQVKGWWDGYRDDVATTLMDQMWLESKAVKIAVYEPILIPGLLQTPGYTRSVMQASDPDASSQDLDRWLEVRMNRQIVVTRHNPISFAAIIDQATIARVVTVPDPAEQLDYLIEVAQRPHMEIRILATHAGMHASLGGGFEHHMLEDPYPQVGLLHTSAGDLCVEGEAVGRVARAYDSLVKQSLSEEASRDFMIAERKKL